MTTPEFDFDVCIVGGGPSGVSCAITVAQQGYSVVIVDKKERDKIGDKTCGDAVDKAALIRLKEKTGIEFPSGDEVSDPISKMSIAADEIDLKLSLDAPGFIVDRLKYGQRLLQIAEENGVTIIARAPVREIITEKIDGLTYLSGVVYKHEGQEKSIRSKFTIDASGAYASLRKILPDELMEFGMKRELDDEELWPTYREIIDLDPSVANHKWPEEILLMYDNDYPPPGYFWVFSKGKGQLNVGIGWEKTQNLGKLKERFREELHKYYKPSQYTTVKSGGGQIPFRPPFDSLVFNGGALAGDAACMVHPVTAEGHGPALDTGAHLGKTLIDALRSGKRDKHSLWQYNVKVASHYGRKHVEADMMKRLLREVGADGLKYLIEKKIFREDELNLLFSGGVLELSIREQISRVLKLVPRPKIMLRLREILSLTEKSKKLYSQYPDSFEGLEEWRRERNRQLKVNF